MWVIRDTDSTVYITGTVHMLPPGIKWESEKLVRAIRDSKELWLELAIGADRKTFARRAGPVILRYARTVGKPISAYLTKREVKTLRTKLRNSGMPTRLVDVINTMKPWYATMLIGSSPLKEAGFSGENGMDLKIASLATAQGAVIHGFETIEDQSRILSSGTQREQIAVLRYALGFNAEQIAMMTRKSKAAFIAWAEGDEHLLTTYFGSDIPDDAEGGRRTLDSQRQARNKNWVNQIEAMLKGSGTHFIAVGAGHLVGPKSVQELLKERGIKAERY
ncbi:MAG: TraB/GumN family protein [Hyphomonadaceae bacterium]